MIKVPLISREREREKERQREQIDRRGKGRGKRLLRDFGEISAFTSAIIYGNLLSVKSREAHLTQLVKYIRSFGGHSKIAPMGNLSLSLSDHTAEKVAGIERGPLFRT